MSRTLKKLFMILMATVFHLSPLAYENVSVFGFPSTVLFFSVVLIELQRYICFLHHLFVDH